MPDVAGGVGIAANATERVSKELGERRLAVGAGDRDQASTPEQRREIKFPRQIASTAFARLNHG